MENSKKQRIYKMIMVIALTALLTFMATSLFMYNVLGNATNGIGKYILLPNKSGFTELEQYVKAVRGVIDSQYINHDEIDENEMIQNAIKGYVAGLGDEYSEYMTAEEWKEFQQDAIGNFEGIGIYTMNDTEHNKIVIVSPIPESAAEKAGVKPGDILVKVNDIAYTGEQLDEALKNIKGPEGTSVKIEVLRGDKTFTFDIVREVVRTNPIETQTLKNNIGYMRLLSFDEGIGKDFVDKYNTLADKGMKGLIIDLRFNTGGYVQGALEIAEALLPKDKTMLITNSKSEGEVVYKSKENNEIKMPIVLLVNEYSASSTEILAGALKDNDRAKIVGVTTFGKGVLQNVFSINGNMLKLTTDEFFTPNRDKIHETGIEPHYIVELPEEYRKTLSIPEDKDTQLQKAMELF